MKKGINLRMIVFRNSVNFHCDGNLESSIVAPIAVIPKPITRAHIPSKVVAACKTAAPSPLKKPRNDMPQRLSEYIAVQTIRRIAKANIVRIEKTLKTDSYSLSYLSKKT